MVFKIIIGVILLLIILKWVTGGKYYKRIFSEEHKRKVYDWFIENIQIKEVNHEGIQLLTDEGLGFVMTKELIDDEYQVHVSLSEVRGYTTGAVSESFGGLLVYSLSNNQMEINPYMTQTGVRHIIFSFKQEIKDILSFDETLKKSNEMPRFTYRREHIEELDELIKKQQSS